jgi:hypothetical protein
MVASISNSIQLPAMKNPEEEFFSSSGILPLSPGEA